ncbi:hypothetical protein J1N35_005728 [Gossypium stocksii]|uniref:Reverse transcriptase zinc-binding domain-containing protein n=1 Tax=Gossypium stocksii TaxID=47602 RepID=A0A9D4AJ92_9ROSI|nr:hypothetical protein J1N35_005728 [Gossypium stocksii]
MWKIDLMKSTFPANIAQKILQIPLAETLGADFQVWKGELSGELWVRNAYKLLQIASSDPNNILIQVDLKNFYKQLWNLKLPSKITITVWRASWNYMPTLVNLRSKRVADNTICPHCRSGEEDISHVFRHCPVTTKVWQMLELSWVNNLMIQSFWDWVTWIFRGVFINNVDYFTAEYGSCGG